MTAKTDFSEEEWTRLKRAPFVAGLAISLADPGGPIEAAKESMATLRTVRDAAEKGGRGELVDALARDAAADMKERKNPLSGFKPSRGAMAGEEILEEIRGVGGIVSAKAPDESGAFNAWLIDAAQEAADAAKEGGFLGFGAVQVSEGEQRMLAKLREALPAG
jgi:hypothetical protein